MTAVLPGPAAPATDAIPTARPRTKAGESDFAPLVADVKEHLLLRRRRGRYVLSVAGDTLLLGAAVVILVAAAGAWWALWAAVPLALWSARIGFLGHDAGHRQIARTNQANRRLGLVLANVLSGMSQGWWDRKHNRHHANPNDVEKDPDVGTGVIAWTPEQSLGRGRFMTWLAAHQGYAFVPLLTLEGLNLKVASAQDVVKRRAWFEGALIVAHFVLYFGLLSLVLSPLQVVCFFLVHQAIFGLHLGLAFAPNHKGMPMPQPGERWTHLQRQVLTSRNVRPHPLTDWLMGGLNYQVEHHLFPSVPRPTLHKLKPFVEAHCATVGLPYTETSAGSSYAIALAYLHEVGTELR